MSPPGPWLRDISACLRLGPAPFIAEHLRGQRVAGLIPVYLGAAGGDDGKHLHGIRPATIDVIDHDQLGRSRNEVTGRAVKIHRPCAICRRKGATLLRCHRPARAAAGPRHH